MKLPANSIFICYRRDDSADATGRLYDRLERELPRGVVFRDVDNIPPGVDFRDHVENAIRSCRLVFVMIGPSWVEARNSDGTRRLDDEGDHVRIEVEKSLARKGVLVVPVLVGGAQMPSSKALPESIRNLAFRNAVLLRRDPDFRTDADRIVRHIKTLLLDAPKPAPTTDTSPPAVPAPVAAAPRASHVLVLLTLVSIAAALAFTSGIFRQTEKEQPTITSPTPKSTSAPAAPAPATPAPAALAPAAPGASGDVAEITIKPDVANPLAFDLKQFTVKAGQKVKLTFHNTHPSVPQPHNICIGKPETNNKLLDAAMGMATAPDGMAKGFIPDSPDVLFHTKLLQPNMVEVLEFTAPAAGAYPYICTFPGHGILMNGVMNVE